VVRVNNHLNKKTKKLCLNCASAIGNTVSTIRPLVAIQQHSYYITAVNDALLQVNL